MKHIIYLFILILNLKATEQAFPSPFLSWDLEQIKSSQVLQETLTFEKQLEQAEKSKNSEYLYKNIIEKDLKNYSMIIQMKSQNLKNFEGVVISLITEDKINQYFESVIYRQDKHGRELQFVSTNSSKKDSNMVNVEGTQTNEYIFMAVTVEQKENTLEVSIYRNGKFLKQQTIQNHIQETRFQKEKSSLKFEKFESLIIKSVKLFDFTLSQEDIHKVYVSETRIQKHQQIEQTRRNLVVCQYPCKQCTTAKICTECENTGNRGLIPDCRCLNGFKDNGATCEPYNLTAVKVSDKYEISNGDTYTTCEEYYTVLGSANAIEGFYRDKRDENAKMYCLFDASFYGLTLDSPLQVFFQRKDDSYNNFDLTWEQFKSFNGNDVNFLIGLEDLNKSCGEAGECTGVFMYELFTGGNTYYIKSSDFYLGDESQQFTINYPGTSGTAPYISIFDYHSGGKLSTKDRENDTNVGVCYSTYGNKPMWYKNCYNYQLLGDYNIATGMCLDNSGSPQVCLRMKKLSWGFQNKCIGSKGLITSRNFLDTCSCPNGYYDNFPIIDECQTCPSVCTKCTSLTLCTECQPNRAGASCDCVDRFYDDGTLDCEACHISCLTCTGTQANNCLSCVDPIKDLIGGTCVCPSIGYYPLTSDDNPTCGECNELCKECQNTASECSVCAGSLANKNIAPLCTCESGFFMSDFFDCLPCSPECAECSNSPTNCTACKSGSNRKTTISDCSCEDNYFENSSLECQICPEKCSKCSDINTCTECQTGINTYRLAIDNNCECKQGYYEDLNQGLECLKCEHPFLTCLSQDTGLTCKKGFQRSETLPCLCQDNYFNNGQDANCYICQYPCINCINTATNCVSCNTETIENRKQSPLCTCQDGYYDNSGKCEICDLKCKKCANSPYFCLECTDQITRNNDSDCSCKTGLKEIGSAQCGNCDLRCDSCNGGVSNCISCAMGLFRTMEAPECGCIDGYYEQISSINCQQCSDKCLKCENNSETCTVCANSIYLPPFCEQEQKGKFTTIDLQTGLQTVQSCNFECEKCNSKPENCSTCKLGLNRLNNPPLCQCQPGYHDEGQNSYDCIECPQDCLICPNSEHCYECENGVNRILNSFNGQCECQLGYKENQYTKKCQECFEFQGECLFQCPQNTYTDLKYQQCIQQVIQQSNIVNLVFIGAFLVVLFLILTYFVIGMQIKEQIKFRKQQLNYSTQNEAQDLNEAQQQQDLENNKKKEQIII